MNDRIQRALDGELAREVLSLEEKAELARAEALIGGVLRTLPGGPVADLAPAVLARIENLSKSAKASGGRVPDIRRAADRGGWRASLEWCWRPQRVSVTWRPAYAFGGAAIVLILLAVGRPMVKPETNLDSQVAGLSSDAAPAAGTQVLVQFRLDAPQARQVALAGEFTNWQPIYPLKRSEPGIWTVVVPLEPGIHDYAFIVDGERWVPDPMAPAVEDGFGGLNSRVAVITPDPRRPM